jgi:hypothetical protein
VTTRIAIPRELLLVTNALASGAPTAAWRFSLGGGAPSGATVNETNGVLGWTPACVQASRSFDLAVFVTDTGNTNVWDAVTFTIAVTNCIEPKLGRQVLLAGNAGRVPIQLISSVPLTNLSMTLSVPAERVTNLWMEPIVPEICSHSIAPLADSLYRLSLTTCAGQSLIGTQQVAWLHFTTVSHTNSALVSLDLDDTVGVQPNGVEVRNFAAQSGRLVIVGENPLLEAVFDTNGAPAVLLYGQPGATYTIGRRADLPDPATADGWPVWWQGALEDLFREIPVALPVERAWFLRAWRP